MCKYFILIFAFLWLLLPVACGQNETAEVVKEVVTKVYTAPSAELDSVWKTMDSPDTEKTLAAFYNDKIEPDYLLDFVLKVGYAFTNYTQQQGSSMVVKSVEIKAGENSVYNYTAEILCTTAQGEEATIQTSGTVRLSGNGLVENVNPHTSKDLLRAIGMTAD